ncbi:hypothetical protein L2E82_19509 [Cichorium intybus]|uniref:Uncharacterized protein n=1 Tax=Cichorium intybus TaxID=13427 RepID=A0ACB9FC50_CICIN|nr:hypothetical protein L2E82_19509 [Cichorium intybus]
MQEKHPGKESKKEYETKDFTDSPLVVTGRGLGGYLAILFTLFHQHAVDLEEYNGSKTAKRPICITFGAPLLGDETFRPYEKAKRNEDKFITYMEWYMKIQRSEGRNYYDSYKKAETKKEIERQQEVIRHQRILNQYWKKLVDEKNRMPQKEGAKLRKRWLYSGTNYRRIVEPLDIADYYKRGNTDYIGNRPNHYELLEKWSEDDKKGQMSSDGKMKAVCLTEDSCFWAHVEEAVILLRELKNGGSSSFATDIEGFEVYIWEAIQNFSVSPDVFLEGSSLMKWWSDYKVYKGSSYDSEFARYMNDGRYTSYR